MRYPRFPIETYHARGNDKTVWRILLHKVADSAYQFLFLILRTIVYFNPLRIFLPLGAVPFLLGFGKLIHDFAQENITDSAVMGILSGFIIWAVGLLSDQISRVSMAVRQR